MGKVKQTVGKFSKPLGMDNKITKKKVTTKKAIKTNNLVPILKKIGIDALLHDSKPKSEFKLDEIEEKPVTCLISNPNKNLFDEDQIKSGVSALFKLIEKTSGQEPTLFEDGENIFLQITSIKVPKTPSRQIHMNLPHSLLKSDAEICLIVQDREDPKDYDNTIDYYEKLLKKHDISNVKCILPYHQFKSEYGNQFELKRKLASLYDFFLVEGAVHGYVVARLGKVFYAKRKMPTAINLKAHNLKTHFENLLHKTILQIHFKSDSFSVEVGNTKMKSDEVAENVIAISDALDEHFPGGCNNVRSLGVKTNTSIRIPLYLTLRSKLSVNVPVIKAKRPKGFKPVSGELTTFANRNVTVLPSGEIVVKDKKRQRENDFEDELEPEFEFDDRQSESEDEEQPKIAKKEKQVKKKAKKDKDVREEEEGEDSNLEEAEENYLNFYQQEQVKLAKERKENKKNKQNKKVEEDEESEDDLDLEDSDESDFEHPNFDDSDEESDESESEEIIANFAEKKGKNKPLNLHQQGKVNKKETKNTKAGKINGNANLKGKADKPQVKKENTKVQQETKKSKKSKEEEIPILVEVPQGVSKKGKKVVFETKKETVVQKVNGQETKKGKKSKKGNDMEEMPILVEVLQGVSNKGKQVVFETKKETVVEKVNGQETKKSKKSKKGNDMEEIPILVEVPQGVSKKGKQVVFETKKETVVEKASGQETKKNQKSKKENEMEVIPILVEVPKGKKRKQEVLETKKETVVEKASGQKNTKLTKKQKKPEIPTQKENVQAPEQDKIEAAIKQNKKAVLTKQNGNATSPKQNKKKFVVKEIVVESPAKKVKKDVENKSPKQQRVNSKVGKAKFDVNKKSGKMSSPFAKKAK